MARYISPVALSNLQAFRFWLRNFAPGWDVSLPQEDKLVEEGKEYPPFDLYRDGVLVGAVDTPLQALDKIGDSLLRQEYERLVTEDPDCANDPVKSGK